MKVDLFIAWRYLFAKKSHNVINVISAISSAGMALGTAALILILSVYNGFDKIIEDNMSDLAPDILVCSANGKHFIPEGESFQKLLDDDRIESISSILEDNVFITYDGRQGVATAKGVDIVYEEESPVASHVVEGEFSLRGTEQKQTVVGAGLAREMGIHPHFLNPIVLHFPRKGASLSLSNPVSSLSSVRLRPSAVFSISTDVDNSLLIVPIESMRKLVGCDDNEVSALELRTSAPVDRKLMRSLQDMLGPDFRILDRHMQNPAIYKMMRYEKLAIFMILAFVVIVIAFNIFGSLSMLRIEKREDMVTLKAMGATDSLTRRIFVIEGWLVTLLGMVAGLACGIVLAAVQQHWGILKMPGGFLLQAYPVVLHAGDILITCMAVAGIGLLVSLLAAGKDED